MKRVMIVGGPGSGNSTLARALGAATGLPVHHMDHIHWMSGWQQRSRDQRRQMAMAVEAQETWIFEGGFSTTYANRLSRADTVIWLDLPVGLRLWRVTKRLFRYWGQVRPDLPEGCPEGIHKETWAFYVWIWTTRSTAREKLAAHLRVPPANARVHHLTSPAQVRGFLEDIPC